VRFFFIVHVVLRFFSPRQVAGLLANSIQRRISVSDLMQTYSTILNLHHTKKSRRKGKAVDLLSVGIQVTALGSPVRNMASMFVT
jgi:hypothetical protein